jgi:hypothetical protein
MAITINVGFKHFDKMTIAVRIINIVDRREIDINVPIFLPNNINSFEIKNLCSAQRPHIKATEITIPGCINAVTNATPAVTNA